MKFYQDWQKQDPGYQREKQKYEKPIPSREYLEKVFVAEDRPLSVKELIEAFDLPRNAKIPLRKRLNAMERDGFLLRNRRKGYCLVEKISVIPGVVIGHKDGFGFVKPDDGSQDVFLSHRQMKSALHGDRVAVRIKGKDRRGRPEGHLVEVLERKTKEIVGRFVHEKGLRFVIPDNSRFSQSVFIAGEHTLDAKPGQIVLVKLIEYPSKVNPPIGKVSRILGQPEDPGLERLIAILSHGLPYTWSKKVKAETSSWGDTVSEKDKQGRVDLRDLPLVTIDGADAKDFDDAIYVEKKRSGWKLIVAIADVSHYVPIGSELNKEAHERGTSVYFANKVVPMLPEELSNGLCSLNPAVDRLCMVCEIDLDNQAKVKKSKFYQGVMHSHARLTYNQVAEMLLENKKSLRQKYKDLLPHLQNALDLYHVFDKARKKRGAMDFDMAQVKMEFDQNDKVKDILLYERNPIHKMIEEFMIAANVEAAKFLGQKNLSTLYRVHPSPDMDRMEELSKFLNLHGLSLGRYNTLTAKHFAKVLEQAKERDDKDMIETVILRSMQRAVYSPDNIGHFGLAHENYAHFTSPIRRYPDLLVHRGIRHLISGNAPKSFAYRPKEMETLGVHCSMTERRADDATREATDWLKCEFMSERVGEVFEAVISSVQDFGLFVEIPEYKIEGLIHVSSLDNDYYHYDRERQWLRGEHAGKTFKLRDRVKVRLTDVDMVEKQMAFELADLVSPKSKRQDKKHKSGK
ncbi:MAG: ribonuclease R, partial [Gammaproteobacteria bacterium]|nr:ribonuclease R [Gammaproteobacteria bacterium]